LDDSSVGTYVRTRGNLAGNQLIVLLITGTVSATLSPGRHLEAPTQNSSFFNPSPPVALEPLSCPSSLRPNYATITEAHPITRTDVVSELSNHWPDHAIQPSSATRDKSSPHRITIFGQYILRPLPATFFFSRASKVKDIISEFLLYCP
jgi:hypothetical protein